MSLELPKNKDIVYFAKTHYRNSEKIFGIQRKDRRQHMYVLGKSGMGKSTLLSNMLLQDIRNGDGVAVVDPHGEMVEDLLGVIPRDRLDDVVYFNPSDIDYHVGFNVLEVFDPKYKHLVASGIMGIFTKIWANVWSSRMEYILNNCILALIDTPGTTLLGIPRLLVDKNYRQHVVNNIKDPVVRSFWVNEYETWEDRYRKEAIAPIQNKVGQFLSNSIVRNILGQQKSTISITDIMDKQKIFLVNLSKGRVGEDNSALLGAMIITKIQLAAMERVKISEDARKDFYLYVDEFQNFVTDSFATILSEARKYRLNLIIAHQYIAQLEVDTNTVVRDAVFGNVGTMVIGRVGAADAAFLETEFMPEFTPDDFVSLPNHHVYLKLLVDGMITRPFSAKTLPPIVKMERRPKVEAYIANRSRKLYHRPRHEVEEEITRWGQGGTQAAANVKVDKDGKGSDGKYHVPCSFDDCDHIATVPFKPESGRPVYCRDCIAKIKAGEKKPISNSRTDKPLHRKASPEQLAALGIEFSSGATKKPSHPPKQSPNRPDPPKETQKNQERNKKNQQDQAKAQPKETNRTSKQNNKPKPRMNKNPHPKQNKPNTRQRTESKADLRSAIQDALQEVDMPPKATNETPLTPVERPQKAAPKPTLSLKELQNKKSITEEHIDLEDRYQQRRDQANQKPTKPKFDASKQAGEDKVSALRAALAKAGSSPNPPQEKSQPEPKPETGPPTTTPKQTTPQADSKQGVPNGLLQRILSDDDE